MFDAFQFYPTPRSLADRAVSLFQNENVIRVLEPSAGNGDLLRAFLRRFPLHRSDSTDFFEIDPARHENLRKFGTLIGMDFLESADLSLYSHVLMNPPFRVGVTHVLHAWKKLYQGEIVAILNASGVRDPETAEEVRLAGLIAEHGSVSYVEEAFLDPETERKTAVEVALIHLHKKQSEKIWDDSLLQSMERDSTDFSGAEAHAGSQIMLNEGQIVAMVRGFELAWEARKQSIIADHKAMQVEAYFDQQVRKILKTESPIISAPHLHRNLQEDLGVAYAKIRHAAWMSVLATDAFQKLLTRKARSELLANFKEIEKMNFSVSNVYGFLQGFSLKSEEIHLEMVCDLFDQITYANSENCLFYRWKSNLKHQVGMALQRKRFILSGFHAHSYGLDYDAEKHLQEIDRIFAMVDGGKAEPEESLHALFSRRFDDLRHGERLSCTYFEVRYYPGIGTIHFYPKDQKLIDKINIIVGKYRCWMPEDFAPDYGSSEKEAKKAEKKMEEAQKAAMASSKAFIKNLRNARYPNQRSISLHEAMYSLRGRDETAKETALQRFSVAMDAVEAEGMESNFWEKIPALEQSAASQPEEAPIALVQLPKAS